MVSTSDWPIRKALTKPVLIMGTEKTLLVMNITLCLVWALASRLSLIGWLAIPLFMVLHGFSVMVSSSDPRAVEAYKRSNRYRQGYYPPIAGMQSAGRVNQPFSSLPYRTGGRG